MKEGRSGQTNLIASFDKIADFLDKGNEIYLIYLDFSRAYGMVPHGKLFVKLENIGISRGTERWVKDCLKERQQKMVLKEKVSEGLPVSSGILYGSILGLISLFQLRPRHKY